MTLLALLLAPLVQQSDISNDLASLSDDLIEVREAAARRLLNLGVPILTRLEEAVKESKDPEVRTRLISIIESIKKGAELRRVFGPTKRVTITAKRRTLRDVLQELTTIGGVLIVPGECEPLMLIDLDCENVTWWEALDRAANACGSTYEIASIQGSEVKVVLKKGCSQLFPAHYLEQFRIAVAELKNLELSAPGSRRVIGFIAVEMLHQPNMKPAASLFRKALRIESVRDAKGNDVQVKRPDWAGAVIVKPRHLGTLSEVWVNPEAIPPIVLCGTTDIPFAMGGQDIKILLTDVGKELKVGGALLSVEGLSRTNSGTRLTLCARAENARTLASSLEDLRAVLVDVQGRQYTESSRSEAADNDEYTWELKFPAEIESPRELRFRWVSDFYQVTIPFRLEGLRLPR